LTGALSQKSANLLTVPNSTPGRFYLLPKIHKDPNNPPGRPIVASNGHPTERISQFVDEHLKEHTSEIPSYIKDSSHFVEICSSLKLPPNAKIITFDVQSLYTNIPHSDGLIALENFMSKYYSATTTKMITQLTKLVLENNIVEFDGKLYLQISGTSMGSRMAPNYACIFVHDFETKHLPNAPVQPLIWKRYIDDIFAIFTCSEEDLIKFQNWLNTLHPTIKFTAERNPDGIPFLDTFVTIEDDRVITRPYTKPTDKKMYIHPKSCHPYHTITSIPYSQALRIKRICSKNEDFEKELANLRGYFVNRHYPESVVDAGFKKATDTNQVKKTPTRDLDPTTLIIPYHPTNPKYAKVISTVWTKHENHLYDICKPIVSYSRPPNIKETVTSARYGKPVFSKSKTPTDTVINKPLSTYDKNQVNAPVQHVMFRCNNEHCELYDALPTLDLAHSSREYKQFQEVHQECLPCNIIPVDIEFTVTVKCTECNFKAVTKSSKKINRIQDELLNSVTAYKNATFRKAPDHKRCSLKCNTCSLHNPAPHVTDRKGSHFRFLPFNCKLKNVIYLISCNKCQLNYVGQTKMELKNRLQGHLSAIKLKKRTALAIHFNSPGHDLKKHLKIAIMDTTTPFHLGMREAAWIHKLSTITHGLNLKDEARINLDFQLLLTSRHFLHSKSCLPYILPVVSNVTTMYLEHYKRLRYGR
jgi:hypothetical protein